MKKHLNENNIIKEPIKKANGNIDYRSYKAISILGKGNNK